MAKLDKLLLKAMEIGASDVHIAANNPPMYRFLGDLKKFNVKPFPPAMTEALLYEIIPSALRSQFEKDLELDFCYQLPGTARFRTNVLNQRLGIDASFRIVPLRIPTLEELGLPEVTKRILDQHQGMILVTGATGHGKSTTLAAMVSYLNETKAHHIITVEDPIEFIHPIDKKAVVNQREIGRDTLSFGNALRGALREDPDIIVIGELRDAETISLAMTAAETGQLVLGTLSTPSAHKTIDRIIDSYPPEEQNQVRTMLADSLKAVITQRLLKNKDETGRVLATEVLIGTMPVAAIIRDNKTFQVPSMMQTGKRVGMQRMDEDLMRLLNADLISPEVAYTNALGKEPFKRFLKQ